MTVRQAKTIQKSSGLRKLQSFFVKFDFNIFLRKIQQGIIRGPYRWLNHPNYLAVALELATVPLIFGVWVTPLVASVLNALLLLGIHILAEDKALMISKWR